MCHAPHCENLPYLVELSLCGVGMVLEKVGHGAFQRVTSGSTQLKHHLEGHLGGRAFATWPPFVHAVGLEGQLESRGNSCSHLLREGLDVGVVVLR